MSLQRYCSDAPHKKKLLHMQTVKPGQDQATRTVHRSIEESLTIFKAKQHSSARCLRILRQKDVSGNTSGSRGEDSSLKLGESISIKSIRLLSSRSVRSNASTSQYSGTPIEQESQGDHTALLNRLFKPAEGNKGTTYGKMFRQLAVNGSQQAWSRESYFAGSMANIEQPTTKTRQEEENLFLKKQCSTIIQSLKDQEETHRQNVKSSSAAISDLNDQVERLRKELSKCGRPQQTYEMAEAATPILLKKQSLPSVAVNRNIFHQYFSTCTQHTLSSRSKEKSRQDRLNSAFKKKERKPISKESGNSMRSPDWRLND